MELGIVPLRFEDFPALKPAAPAPQLTLTSTVLLIRKDGTKLNLTPEGSEWLAAQLKRLRIGVICGPPLSGKSSLLNDICGEPRFQVGADSNTTGGVWATVLDETLLLDTQGITPGFDQFTALLLILASLLIYNSVGTIDKRAVTYLSLFAQARHWISVGSPVSDLYKFCASFRPIAPDFVWVLRDFTLTLEEPAKEYMETVLRMENPSAEFVQSKELLQNLFPTRDCYSFPVRDEVDSQYQEVVATLKSAVLRCPFKSLFDFDVTGPILVKIITKAVDYINQRKTIDLQVIYDEICEENYAELLKLLEKTYLNQRRLELTEMPYEEAQLAFRMFRARKNTLEIVSTSHLTSHKLLGETMDEFMHFTMENEAFAWEANATASHTYNLRLLEKFFLPVIATKNDTELDWVRAARQYEEQAVGPSRLKALVEFMEAHPFPSHISLMENVVRELRRDLQATLDCNRDIAENLERMRKRLQEKEISENDMLALIKQVGERVNVPEIEKWDSQTYLESIYLKLKSVKEEASKDSPKCSPVSPPQDEETTRPNPQPPVNQAPKEKKTHCRCTLF